MRGLKHDGERNQPKTAKNPVQWMPPDSHHGLFNKDHELGEDHANSSLQSWKNASEVKSTIQLKHALQSKFKAQQQSGSSWDALIDGLDALGLGFEVWDRSDRLLAYNRTINHMQAGLRAKTDLGASYEALLRKNVTEQTILVEALEDGDWLKQRIDERHNGNEPFLYALPGDHWVQTYGTKTYDGLLMDVWVDVTQFVRKSRILEAINRELAIQSTTDGLTGIANRRRFDQALSAQQNATQTTATPISLLMIDIDHFKKYNDFYGHQAGDECLRKVADLLAQCTRRSGDLLARYGGEEFVLFLPGMDLKSATDVAKDCLVSIARAKIPHQTSPTHQYLTLSIGIASILPDASLNAANLIGAADRALYRAKSGGRNRYYIAQGEEWDASEAPENLFSFASITHRVGPS